ncbi:hypothetical protein ACH4VS_22945 [Streptomyces hygroscopicus]|uniref:hypothetical protein n=1 Tax=Streptomyces hygroscopicus TaxID=1912 RepID=UPI00099EF71D|nr:hypothetical protein [Streptomyces hygroscopicus]
MSKETNRSSEEAPSVQDAQDTADTADTADAVTAGSASGTADGAEAARSGKEDPAGEGTGIPRQQPAAEAAEAADRETGQSART